MACAAGGGLPEIDSVKDGVFFARHDVLPRGRHRLAPEVVRGIQRERMLAGMTELLAAHGYRAFGAADIVKRANVSLAAFYACFDNKDACIFEGYDRFIQVLLERVIAVDAPSDDRVELTSRLLEAYLATLGSDLVVARAYQVEIDALGAEARARRRSALSLFAQHLRNRIAETSPGGAAPPEIPWSAYIGIVYATRQLASDLIDVSANPDLDLLGSNLRIWVADVLRIR